MYPFHRISRINAMIALISVHHIVATCPIVQYYATSKSETSDSVYHIQGHTYITITYVDSLYRALTMHVLVCFFSCQQKLNSTGEGGGFLPCPRPSSSSKAPRGLYRLR